MALEVRTIEEALNAAIARLVPLQTDIRLTANQQALVGELRQADQNALNVLQPDNTILPGQRGARASQIEDAVHALGAVATAHKEDISVDEFYNALDLSVDAAIAIRAGNPTFISDISTNE